MTAGVASNAGFVTELTFEKNKDGEPSKIVHEVADLWFHTMVALAAFGLGPADVLAELERREGTSGLEEFARRKLAQREADGT